MSALWASSEKAIFHKHGSSFTCLDAAICIHGRIRCKRGVRSAGVDINLSMIAKLADRRILQPAAKSLAHPLYVLFAVRRRSEKAVTGILLGECRARPQGPLSETQGFKAACGRHHKLRWRWLRHRDHKAITKPKVLQKMR